MPEGIDLYTVVTGTDANRDNYPPSEWLQAWRLPVLRDDDNSIAATAYGLVGYPYSVMLDGNGSVLLRHFGSLPVETLAAAAAEVGG